MVITLQFDLDKEEDNKEYMEVLKVHVYKEMLEDIYNIFMYKKDMGYLDDAGTEKLEELKQLLNKQK